MAWYLNCSIKAVAIPLGDGNVVAVRPNERIEVKVETEALRRLVRARLVQRSGRVDRPMVLREIPAVATVLVARSDFAMVVSEGTPTERTASSEAAVSPGEAEALTLAGTDEDSNKRRNKRR